jgi:hypothetical protein
VLDVRANDGHGCASSVDDEAGRRAHYAPPVAFLAVGTLFSHKTTGHTLETVHAIQGGHLQRIVNQLIKDEQGRPRRP